ncbi:uncharacterized protein LOC120670066 [Panicum virgatum]|uniref:uncharacterized protein LOC120670066 n=1 Tax=Panicum virgatum TaxID=38727 RepID=UPI0019D66D81|nr:uncharacterized protein LOC120670066 [Panicum virgatum]
MSSRARVMAMDLEHGEHVAPKNSSMVQFVAADGVESPVLNGEVSVSQRNVTPLQSVTWSGLATLCGVCLVFAVSNLIQTNSKAHLLRRLLYMRMPGMEWEGINKEKMAMLKNAHRFPFSLPRRPHLDRKELMNNIKRAKELREWFIFRNSFSCKTAADGDDASIAEIRRTVTEGQTPEGILEQCSIEKNIDVIFPPLFTSEEEVFSINGSQSDFDDVSDYSIPGFSLSSDKIEETVERAVDMKNGAAVMNYLVKDEDNIGEIELPEPAYDNDRTTGANDGTSDINTAEKEAQMGSADSHNLDPNRINRTSCELESEEFAEICANNMDSIQGTKSSLRCITDHQIIYTKDSAHEYSINVVSKSADCFDSSSSELRNNKTPMDISVCDVNAIQEVGVPRISAKDTLTAHCNEFANNMSIIGHKACKTPIVTDIVTATSPHGSSKEPTDLKRDNMRLVQEPNPSICTRNDKQPSHVNEKEHKERAIQKEAQARSEIENTRIQILDSACRSSLYAPEEETAQHKISKCSTSEKKQEKRTSSSKKSRAHLLKNKGKLQKEVCSNKEAKTKQSEQGIPGTKTVNDPSNGVQKTKKLAKKRLKKLQSNMGRVATEDDVQSSMDVQKNNSLNITKPRRTANVKNAFRNQEAQTSDEYLKTAHEVGSPYNSPTDK